MAPKKRSRAERADMRAFVRGVAAANPEYARVVRPVGHWVDAAGVRRPVWADPGCPPEPTAEQTAAAMRVWEGLPEVLRAVLRLHLAHMDEHGVGRERALVTTLANIDHYATTPPSDAVMPE